MFNIQPGQGLGFSGSKQIALGLGTPFAVIIIIVPVEQPVSVPRVGGGGAGYRGPRDGREPGDYLRRREEGEIREIILIIVKSGIIN